MLVKTKIVLYTGFMNLGVKLKNLRLDRKETLHVVAMGTNVDMTLISKFERGERLPTNKQIERIAGYFGLDKKQLAIEATAGKILTEYGYNDVTYEAAMFVQEEMKRYYAKGKEGAKNE
jgi:transcriptional regulator with XRE-family HTH domain